MRASICLCLQALLLSTLAAPALAAPVVKRPPGERAPAITDFWKRESPALTKARERRFQRALTLVRQGVASAIRPRVINRASVTVGQAMLGVLAITHPKVTRFWYWYGYASLLLGKDSRTIKAWKRVWKLSPQHWDTASIAFELGILYAKRGQYAESIAVYKKGMPVAFHLTTRGIMASNCAESFLALGKLRQAVVMYKKSLRLRPQSNSAAWWGLMLAHERLGHTAAFERARRQALTLDPNLRGLIGPGVFFVPKGDVHYYLALAYEGLGRLRDAQHRWRRYLRARPRSRWTKQVRRHQARLRRIMAAWKPRVYLVEFRPLRLRALARPLALPIAACYRRRAAQLKVTPSGQLPLFVTVRAGRVTKPRIGWSPRPLADSQIRKCVLKRLQNHRLPGTKRARLFAVFQLERGP